MNTAKQTARTVFFVQRTVMENGEYVVCIAEEGTKGFYQTDWLWGSDFAYAEAMCNQRNEEVGISKADALKIIVKSMARG
ncbi:hypothetical protein ACXWTF_12915 [Thiomicrolovo sp. ZZH C-3]